MSDDASITDDTPLRLAVAAELAFHGGGMTVSGLRLEASRGRLEIWRIARKDVTTLAAIREMRRLCQIPSAKLQSSAPVTVDSGESAPAACRATIETLRKRLSKEKRK
ncbi:excisionase [Bradyrhizobium sp. B097]|uniref:excisionase n=1 Tax=Bradyrhizobium sp. B097 TaxID=3140244 RepID=UPI003183206A